MSTATFRRVYWIVIDGFGHEHARRCLEASRRGAASFPALERLAREGHLGPAQPPQPVCQTPPALVALFSGAEPRRSRVWGYRMPDPNGLPGDSVSGFSVEPRDARPIWEDFEDRGISFALLNVAFRRDPVWSRPFEQLTLAYDGYRCLRKPLWVRLDGRPRARLECSGIELDLTRRGGSLELRRGTRRLARLAIGEAAILRLTAGTSVYGHRPSQDELALYPQSAAAVRLGPAARGDIRPPAAAEGFRDMDVFQSLRGRLEAGGLRPTVAAAFAPVSASHAQKEEMALWATRTLSPRCTVCYFPAIDEMSHAWLDLLACPAPDPLAVELLHRCWSLVDGFLAELMQGADPQSAVVVSSDHGLLPYRRVLHANELLAAAGLVRRSGCGYDLRRSAAFYHPADCGQLVANEAEAARRGLGRGSILAAARSALQQANDMHHARLAMQEGEPGDPWLAFLYPLADTYLTGDPPPSPWTVVDERRAGGHHLSPLSPDPWIDALLGLWSPEARWDGRAVPRRNEEVKDFVLGLLGGSS